jgi:hypothetical protein
VLARVNKALEPAGKKVIARRISAGSISEASRYELYDATICDKGKVRRLQDRAIGERIGVLDSARRCKRLGRIRRNDQKAHWAMTIQGERASPSIEVTPEMIEAGVTAFLEFDSRYESEADAVTDIYRAMIKAKRHRPSEK